MGKQRGLFDRIIRRVLIGGTLVLTGYCVFALLAGGSGRAWILAAVCASFPIAAWWEAANLRERGLAEAADAIVAWAFSAVLGFSLLVGYVVDLRGEAVDRVER
ncbi:MAG TPA: hypothetical protein VK034_11385 [Enhygromyxa sp.]|nr:hypothetical protein [Enhygromyxa sp.]